MGPLTSSKCQTTLSWRRVYRRLFQHQVSRISSGQNRSLGYLHPIEHIPASSPESNHDRDSQDSEVAHEPIQERYGDPSYTRFHRVASKTIVSFGPHDPENPVNWKRVRWTILGSVLFREEIFEIQSLTNGHVSNRPKNTWFSWLVCCKF